jgi:hypothetical protein
MCYIAFKKIIITIIKACTLIKEIKKEKLIEKYKQIYI